MSRDYLGDETFCLTYGDCVARHRHRGARRASTASTDALATVTAIQPPGRFGALGSAGRHDVETFNEKPRGDGGWVNGGFFVLEPECSTTSPATRPSGSASRWSALAHDGQARRLQAPRLLADLDTLRDKMVLEEQWATGSAPWKIW